MDPGDRVIMETQCTRLGQRFNSVDSITLIVIQLETRAQIKDHLIIFLYWMYDLQMEYQKALESLDPNSTDNFSCSVMEKSSKSAMLENQQDIKVLNCYIHSYIDTKTWIYKKELLQLNYWIFHNLK